MNHSENFKLSLCHCGSSAVFQKGPRIPGLRARQWRATCMEAIRSDVDCSMIGCDHTGPWCRNRKKAARAWNVMAALTK